MGWLLPRWLKIFLVFVLTLMSKVTEAISLRFIMLFKSGIRLLPNVLFRETNYQLKLSSEFMKEVRDQGITHLICPVHSVSAQPHNKTPDAMSGVFWTALWNFIGNPVGVLPIGTIESLSKSDSLCKADKSNPYLTVTPQPDSNGNYYDNYSDGVGDMMEFTLQQGCKTGNINNLPIGIQVVGMMWEDESVVGLMKKLQKDMGLTTIG